MKKTTISVAKAIMPLTLLLLLCFKAFGQEKSQKSSIEGLMTGNASSQEQKTQPTPEVKKPTRARKVEEPAKSSTPEEPILLEVPIYSKERYLGTSPADNVEDEKLQKDFELQQKREDAKAQRETQRQQKAYDNEQKKYQEQLLQQQKNRESTAQAQRQQEQLKAQQQEEVDQKVLKERTQWSWLSVLFEALQAIILGIIIYRKKIAVRPLTFIFMTVFFAVIGFYIALFASPQNSGASFFVWMLCFDVLLAGKTAAYIIVLLSQKSLTSKLLSVFSVGIALIAVYTLFNQINIGMVFYNIYGVASGFGIVVIGGVIALVKGTKGSTDDLHGSARFAEKKEFKEFENPVETGAFILAPAHPNRLHGKLALPRSLSLMHGLILGGSGTGKSRGFFMPNCAEVENTSLVVTDPKSELWKYTSGFHDKALRYAPTEPEASQCFNWIPLCTDARMAELCARALMTAGSTSTTDQFWIDSETAFLSAIFAHTATTKYPTPLTAYRLFTRQKPEELMKQLLHSPSYVAQEQAMIFEQTDARIKGAIVPAIASRLQFMRDPNIQLFTSSNLEAPKFGQLRRTPTAVYWCLREQDIARLRPLTSLFFTVLLEQIAGEEVPEDETSVPITAMLDEFANIGKIPDFETTISLARGRGVALWLGVQSLSQFKQTYGEHAAQTIMSNCATKVALHGLDYQTAEYVSKMLGEQTISHSSSSFNIGLSGGSVGSSAGKHRRPLLTPDEVMRIDENEAIARTSNKYPMRLYKGYYDAAPRTYPVTPTLTKVYVEEAEVVEDLAL